MPQPVQIDPIRVDRFEEVKQHRRVVTSEMRDNICRKHRLPRTRESMQEKQPAFFLPLDEIFRGKDLFSRTFSLLRQHRRQARFVGHVQGSNPVK